MDFDVIPYDDIIWGRKLGAGSFGSVYKGSYLGIDIAIKEVLPSTEYDVHKYFEREWRIMRECRHPNVVLFLGLSRAPEGDDRVFIISEFLPRGNLRQFILSAHPFPWRLRLSFATDVARAVAYLHARQCIHRDLKGENLLITANERIKVTDFGFARISSRNAEEMRRMTYCGTDGYMSPEILNGVAFDLPTDVFSLGIIFIEILSRRLVDSKTFVRTAPSFTPDPEEVKRRASPGCPQGLIDLALHCTMEETTLRPKMPEVLERLRRIEIEVLSRLGADDGEHVGSIKLLHHHGKRAMPVFNPTPAKGDKNGSLDEEGNTNVNAHDSDDDGKLEEAVLKALSEVRIESTDGAGEVSPEHKGSTWRTARWGEGGTQHSQYATASEMRGGHQRANPFTDSDPSIDTGLDTSDSTYSTNVIRAKPDQAASALRPTVPFCQPIKGDNAPHAGNEEVENSVLTVKAISNAATHPTKATSPGPENENADKSTTSSKAAIGSEVRHHADSKGESSADSSPSSDGQGMIRLSAGNPNPKSNAVGTHRFTLVGKEVSPAGKKVSAFASHFGFAFLPKSLAKTDKCPVCQRRLGQRPALQCDDCGSVVHVKCSHAAPRDCTLMDAVIGVKLSSDVATQEDNA